MPRRKNRKNIFSLISYMTYNTFVVKIICMTQLVLNIKDSHVAFFLDLIRRFDFVKIENEKGSNELTDHQKNILDERLNNYQNNPDSYLDWEDIKKDIEKRYEV